MLSWTTEEIYLILVKEVLSSKSKNKNILSEVYFFSSSVHCPGYLDSRFAEQLDTVH